MRIALGVVAALALAAHAAPAQACPAGHKTTTAEAQPSAGAKDKEKVAKAEKAEKGAKGQQGKERQAQKPAAN